MAAQELNNYEAESVAGGLTLSGGFTYSITLPSLQSVLQPIVSALAADGVSFLNLAGQYTGLTNVTAQTGTLISSLANNPAGAATAIGNFIHNV